MNFIKHLDRYTVRTLTEADIPSVYALCRGNPLYYRHCPPQVTEDSIRSDMEALPPGKNRADKYYLGYFDGNRLAAVMDYIHGFPDGETVFIGFFIVDSALQGQKVGSGIIRDLCACLQKEGTRAIRLGWVQGNPQAEHFWKKNGFRETGTVSETAQYTIVLAEKRLDGDIHES